MTIVQKNVVIVRSTGPRGRVGLVAQHHVYRQPDSDTPSVGPFGWELAEVMFPEAVEPTDDGVQRRFWATHVEGGVFRDLLRDGIVAEPDTAFMTTRSTPDARALVNRAIDHVAAALREGQESDSS